MERHEYGWRVAASAAAGLGIAASASAQFGVINPQTDIVEKISGELLSANGAPTPEAGDQIGAFWNGEIIGSYIFTSTQTNPLAWDMIIFGDDPDTGTVKEGPAPGEVVTFRFFDSSTNTTRNDVAPTRQDNGEVITVIFEGEETFQFPVQIPGAPPFPGAPGPSIAFDLTLGIGVPGGGGNGDGDGDGGGGSGSGNPDVNGDGKVDKYDAALVFRVMAGATRGVTQSEAARADVDNNGVVNSNDAILILSNRGKFENTP